MTRKSYDGFDNYECKVPVQYGRMSKEKRRAKLLAYSKFEKNGLRVLCFIARMNSGRFIEHNIVINGINTGNEVRWEWSNSVCRGYNGLPEVIVNAIESGEGKTIHNLPIDMDWVNAILRRCRGLNLQIPTTEGGQ